MAGLLTTGSEVKSNIVTARLSVQHVVQLACLHLIHSDCLRSSQQVCSLLAGVILPHARQCQSQIVRLLKYVHFGLFLGRSFETRNGSFCKYQRVAFIYIPVWLRCWSGADHTILVQKAWTCLVN